MHKPQALVVQNRTSGTPISSAAAKVKLMIPSETMHVTGGMFDVLLVSLSFASRSLKGAKQVSVVDLHREGMSCVASASQVGSPSGIVSNWNDERPSSEWGPRDLRRRLWLNSVLTKVM
ncbi:hypothetical protein RDI58_028441 [Solanum bulbocastanum]|uniref:Uncharacterized protein n=1 Tax=Solanum bulbocastanum TaxID=147425 RepID=A0AAN8Y166_SOLBU